MSRKLMIRGGTMIAGFGAGAVLLGVVSAPAGAHPAPRVAIAGTHPAWAVRHGSASVPAVTGGTVNARIYLAGRNAAGLTAYAAAVSTPGNSLYGRYLTAKELQSRYGPSSAQIAAVKSWVTGAGLKVTGVKNAVGGYVSVSGPLAAARKAFSVSFGRFKAPNGHTYRAPESAATSPTSVAGDVVAVSGLDTAPHFVKPADTLPPPDPNYWVAPPCSKYYGEKVANGQPKAFGKHQPWNVCGYTQKQIRSAYGVTSSGRTGRGQTVAIVDAYASPTMPGDANQFAHVTGDQAFRAGQYHQYTPATFTETAADECDAPGWYGEETLDIEAVHGQAPDANVHFVAAASCEDSDLVNAEALIVDNHLASIVSNSYGEPADDSTLNPVYDLIFKAGAAEGIGFFFSSGDSGYESPDEDPFSDKIQVDYPASSPWVTSVGGTSLAIGAKRNYQFETSWGTLLDPLASNGKSWQFTPPGVYPDWYDGSSGGGVSTQYTQPSYQRGVVPASLSHHLPNGKTSKTAMRVEPDISALADPSTGMLVGQTTQQPNGKTYAFSLSRIGGTSVACPTFAGIEADAQQAAGHPLGFANPVIYQRYGTKAYHDVTDHPLGSGYLAVLRNNYTDPSTKKGPLITYLRTLGIDGEGAAALPATHGYDDATGVGSPERYIQSF
jgi:subtilase family serine protease